MQEYSINVTEIEELQTIKNTNALDLIFEKAKKTITGGEPVLLVRQSGDGRKEKFDTLTTEEELNLYKKQVYKYL